MTGASMNRRKFLVLIAEGTVAMQLSKADSALCSPTSAGDSEAPVAFDLREVPFSLAGSYLTLSHDPITQPELPLRLATVRKTAATFRYQTGAWSHDLAGFGPEAGDNSPLRIAADANKVELATATLAARIHFIDAENLSIEVTRGNLRMTAPRAFSWLIVEPHSLRGFDSPSGYEYRVSVSLTNYLTHTRHDDHEELFLPVDSHTTLGLRSLVEEPRNLVAADPSYSYEQWMRRCPVFSADDTRLKCRATRVAWFLFWNMQVNPSGGYGRRAILSSKRSLSQVWSWDNLFNAMAVVKSYPELAWDQLKLILNHQLPSGVLPDTVSDARATYGFNKPPLWGWTIVRLLRDTPEIRRESLLQEVYPAVEKLHSWWLRERDLRGDGVPAYLSGNDSGWDNSTIFAEGVPVQSPDLLSLLILDAEALANMADLLMLPAEACAWRNESVRLLLLFQETFVREDRLVVFVQTSKGWQMRESTSLLTRIPILLGRRLPAPVLARIIVELADTHLFAAPCGPASEALSSPLYDPNGYWRGPVWGPSTFLIAAGLCEAGEPALARMLGERFRETCARSATFRENYDAQTGAGQYDSGMTWSAADYLLLGGMNSQAG